MITGSIDCMRIDKSALVTGKPRKDGSIPKYLGFVMFENKNGPDQYGNHGFIAQDLGKDRRKAGEKGPILGNWKDTSRAAAPEERTEQPVQTSAEEMPF